MRSPVIVVIVSGGARGVGFHLKERLRRGCGTAIPHRLTSDGKVVGVDVGHDRVRRVPSVPLTRHVVDVSCDVGLADLVEEEIDRLLVRQDAPDGHHRPDDQLQVIVQDVALDASAGGLLVRCGAARES